jgi:hypothetical protein
LASCRPVQLENRQSGGKVDVRVAALERGHFLF